MNDSGEGARHKAVLAAVLAVQRGFLSPDEAVRVLAELPADAAASPVQTLLSVAPTSAQKDIAAQVEALAASPGQVSQTLAGMGVDAAAQSTLFSLKPDTSSEAATRALASLADRRQRLKDMTSRLPGVSGTGRYVVKREFARGGMGAIYVALDNAVGREVALKELLPVKGADGTTGSTGTPEQLERFLREAKITGQLEHPNIVPVYEIATRDDGTVFYTMKLVRGKTMAHRLMQIQTGPGTDQQKLAQRLKLLDAFTDVCNAVAYAHSRGVIHRDLKPANIMLGDFGETLVLDWGLARVRGQEDSSTVRAKAQQQAFSPSLMQAGDENRTLDGAILGTPAYMPPEQARGALELVDERADVYALGAILYEILSGHPPYVGPSAREVLAKVLVLAPEPLEKVAPLAPPDLVSLAQKAIEREPEARIKSAEALATEVLAYRDGRELSVYRYSSKELALRFLKRNKAAVSVGLIAVLLGLAGGIYAFQRVMSERDQAQLSFEAAEREREGRVAAELKGERDREGLINQRNDEITAQRRRISSLRHDNLKGEAAVRIEELKARGATGAGLAPSDRAENSRIVSSLLEVAAAQAELVRLITEPVAGRSHEFVPGTVLVADRAALQETRLHASDLALLNEDFALAELIVSGTDFPAEELHTRLATIQEARGALLRRHARVIEDALADVRANLARYASGRQPRQLDEYVLLLSGLREPQTVELLGGALKRYVEKARQSDSQTMWTQPERDEITLICRTLGALELPELCVPPLAEWMDANNDTRLAIECGNALCRTSHSLAYGPMVRARKRFGDNTYAWTMMSRRLWRIPEPADLPQPATVEGLIERAEIRVDMGLGSKAREDAEAALLLAPENVRALTLRGTLRGANGPDLQQALGDYDKAIELQPGHARAWYHRASALWNLGRKEDAIASMDHAISLDSKDWRMFHMRAVFMWGMRRVQEALDDTGRAIELYPHYAGTWANRCGLLHDLGDYKGAVAAGTQALELDPAQNEALINRGSAKVQLRDFDGALADFTRLLEVSPGHPWGHMNRGEVRKAMGDYEGAIYDFTQAIDHPQQLWGMKLDRAQCYRALKRYDEAIADLESFRDWAKTEEERAEAEKLIEEIKAERG